MTDETIITFHLIDFMMVPDAIEAAALALPAGSSRTEATVPVLAAWNAPQVPTPEEEAEEEMFTLRMSEMIEGLNERNPDMPPVPVVYPKATRRLQ
jgi:hypothetical protein